MADRSLEIKRAALAVFARYGLKRSSMSDVAQEAGLSRPALYRYFKGKDDLIAACFDLVTEDGFALAEAAAAAEHTPQARTIAYLTTHLGFFYRLIYSGPHSDDLLALKTRYGPDKVAAARARVIVRLNQLAGRPEDDETGIILAHAAEGLKDQAPDEATLTRRLKRLVAAVLA